MDEAFAHCEDLVRRADKDRFLATLFAPVQHRPALHALYAFDLEVTRIPAMARQTIAGEMRLQWWREVLEAQRVDEARANPVASALLATLETYALSRAPLIDLIEARAFDVYSDPFATVAELEAYAERTQGAVMTIAAALLAGDEVEMSASAHEAAVATMICELLREFPARVSRGHLQVPLDLLERRGLPPEDILAGRSGDDLLTVLAELRTLVRAHLRRFRQLSPTLPPAAMPAFLPVALVPLYLTRMDRRGYDPFHTAIIVPQWRRQWTLWRAARTWASPPRLTS
jgi:phytoene synthase